MQPLRIDGLLNATVFGLHGQLYAIGRRCMQGPLTVCCIHPAPAHVAEVPLPTGHVLEDPRFLGLWQGAAVFIAADAHEYFSGAGGWRIHQAVFYLDLGTWKIRSVWRLAAGDPSRTVEKNWVPIGETIHDNGTSRLLYQHDCQTWVELDHGAQTQTWHRTLDAPETGRPVHGDDVVGPPFIRGGTPLLPLRQPGTWGGFGHLQTGAEQTHPTGGWPIRQYVTTWHVYEREESTGRLVPHEDKRLPPLLTGAKIEFASGWVATGRATAVVAVGLNDMDTVFLEVADTAAPELTLPSQYRRLSYLPDKLPLPRPPPLPGQRPTLCLNMIVKNESRIIERLLRSVRSVVDCYCICDTGSTDDTVARIQQFGQQHQLPGRIVHCPFYTFGYNRTFALNAARDMADYVLLLDADMVLGATASFKREKLTAAAYTLEQGSAAFSYHNTRLLRTSAWSECVGATHEFYHVDGDMERLEELRIGDIGDGGSKGDKFERDIRLLTQEVAQDPGNARAHFYLANSYRDTGQHAQAVEHYAKRIELGGWYEEVWYSYYNMGRSYQDQGDFPQALRSWLAGYQFYPGRNENLYEIVKHYRVQGQAELALRFYLWAKSIAKPAQDNLFLHHEIYDYALDYELTVFYYYLKDRSAVPGRLIHQLLYRMLRYNHNVPNVLSNYKFYAQSLSQIPGARIVPLTVPSVGEDFQSSTPCLLPLSDGRLLANVRHNNTVLSEDCTSYHMRQDREITLNQWVLLDPATGQATGQAQEAGTLTETGLSDDPALFAGRQDIRLHDDHGTIRYTATVCRHHEGRKQLCIEHGLYDWQQQRLTETHVVDSPKGAECEKNWCLFGWQQQLLCVYSWHPFVVGRLEDTRFVPLETPWTSPPEAAHLRGSTHGVWYQDELWFGVHLVSYEEPRQYYHALAVVDPAQQTVARLSYPFKLEQTPVEYVCSLDFPTADTLRLAYSVGDKDSRWLEVPVEGIQWQQQQSS